MKEESVLNVLMYLFKNHMHETAQISTPHQDLMDQLEAAGFRPDAINKAISWLTTLGKMDKNKTIEPRNNSFRVFSDFENEALDLECRSFILSLEQQNILTPAIREAVIHQVIELYAEGIDLGLIKWVTLMVLFNNPSAEQALRSMELLVLEDNHGSVQ